MNGSKHKLNKEHLKMIYLFDCNLLCWKYDEKKEDWSSMQRNKKNTIFLFKEDPLRIIIVSDLKEIIVNTKVNQHVKFILSGNFVQWRDKISIYLIQFYTDKSLQYFLYFLSNHSPSIIVDQNGNNLSLKSRPKSEYHFTTIF